MVFHFSTPLLGTGKKQAHVRCELRMGDRRPPVPFRKVHTVFQKINELLDCFDFALPGEVFAEIPSNFISPQRVRKKGTGGVRLHLSSLQSLSTPLMFY